MNNYVTHFKTLAHNRSITSADIFTLCLMKALRSKSEDKVETAKALLKRSFNPVTKPTKLANGADPYGSYKQAYNRVRVNVAYGVGVNCPKTFLTEDEQLAFNGLLAAVQR